LRNLEQVGALTTATMFVI